MNIKSLLATGCALALVALVTMPQRAIAQTAGTGTSKARCGALASGLGEGAEAIPLGSRSLGEGCSKDCQCDSRECKGFKCVRRDLSTHPFVAIGGQCVFDGDCASCDCARGVCH